MLPALGSLSLCLLLSVPASAQAPALFRQLDFEAARSAAEREGKLLLLDAMTSWCGPCKVMDKTTWVDPGVEAWVARHAVAIQLDMDEHEALKQRLEINAFPTMLIFKGAEEFDRVVGGRPAAELLEWLESARSGRREVDRIRAALAELDASGASRLEQRMRLASDASHVGAQAEAGEQALWLWRREPADAHEAHLLRRWRAGGGANPTRDLVRADATFAMALRAERDQRTSSLVQEHVGLREEWLALNALLDEPSKSVTWAAAQATTAAGRLVLQQHETRLFDLLIDHGLWAAAGHALRDPLAPLRFLGDNLGAYDDAEPSASPPNAVPSAVPMIPMGAAPKARSIPAIPMTAAPVTRNPEPPEEAPPATSNAEQAPERAAVPMIPMGMAPAKAVSTEAGQGDVAREVRGRLTHELRKRAARRYGALLAAERLAEAEAVGLMLLSYADDDMARVGLVSAALRAGRFELRRMPHLGWLDDVAQGAGR